jgi:hypothetical protein
MSYRGITLEPYLLERIEQLRSSYRRALRGDHTLLAAKWLGAIEEMEVLLDKVRSEKVKA